METKQRYYIPSKGGIICVHTITDTHVITGDCTNFYADAKTNASRYLFTIEEWESLKPELIDNHNLNECEYLNKNNHLGAYAVDDTWENVHFTREEPVGKYIGIINRY